MGDKEKELAAKLLEGPIPVSLLLHLQESAAAIDHGTIEIVFTPGKSIDVKTTERLRFDRTA